MARVSFKLAIVKMIPTYPLYERFIFAITSSTMYIIILNWARPVSSESEIVFQTPYLFGKILTIVSTALMWGTMIKFGGIGGAVPFKIKDILYGEYL